MNTMYQKFLQLPLFQGLTLQNLTSIIETVKLNFQQYHAKELLAKEGTPCKELIFILDGEIEVARKADFYHPYEVFEYLNAPFVFELQSLFGLDTTYSYTYRCVSEVNAVKIKKNYILTELFNYRIFALNYLNAINRDLKMAENSKWREPAQTTEGHIKEFILSHLKTTSGKKQIKITKKQLGQILNCGTIALNKAIDKLTDDGLIVFSSKGITVPEANRLLP